MAFILSVLLAGHSFRGQNQRLAVFTSLVLAIAVLLLPKSLSMNVFVLLFYGLTISLYCRLNRASYAFLVIVLLLILGLLFNGIITEQWLWISLSLVSCVILGGYLIQGKIAYLLWWLSVLLLAVLMLLMPGWSDNLLLAAFMVSLQLYCALKATMLIPQSEPALKVSEIQAAERSRIYQNIHDDVGAELLRLIYVIEDSEQKKQVKDIMQRLRQAVAQTTQISMDVRQLCDDIIDICRQRMVEANIEFQSEWVIEYNHVFSNTHPTGLLRIMNELLSNIIRHAKAQSVHLQVVSNRQKLDICLTDNGCGLGHQNKDKYTGRGIRGLQKRAAMMGTEIIWQNRPDGGLSTTLSYPWP